MVSEHMNHARNFLKNAQAYLAAAEDSLAAERHTPAAGDAIHAGINVAVQIVRLGRLPPSLASGLRLARQSAEALPDTGGGEGQGRNGLFPPAGAVTRTLMS